MVILIYGDLAVALYNDAEGGMIHDHEKLLAAIRETAREDGWNEEVLYQTSRGDIAILFSDPEAGLVFLLKKGDSFYLVDVDWLEEVSRIIQGFFDAIFRSKVGWPTE